MKKILAYLLCLFWTLGLSAQNISQKELIAFCERAIEHKFSDSLAQKVVLMEMDSNFPIIKKNYKSFVIQFVTRNKAIKLAKKSKNKAVWVNYAKIEMIDKYHIEIYASTEGKSYKIEYLKNSPKFLCYEGGCKQKPDATLIFDQQKQTWEYWSKESIATQEKEDFFNGLNKK